jgi:hypothetical protein
MILVVVEDPGREIHLRGVLRKKYDRLVKQLGADLGRIEARLNEMIEGDRIHTAGWMPGSDWRVTPFQLICEVCGRGEEEAGPENPPRSSKCEVASIWANSTADEAIAVLKVSLRWRSRCGGSPILKRYVPWPRRER